MVRVAFVAVVLAVVPQTLTYRPAPGPAKAVEGEFSYLFEIAGPDALVKQLVTTNPVLAITEIRGTRKGRMTTTAGPANTSHVEVIFDSAKVTSIGAGKPFQFEFSRSSPPATSLQADPPRVFSWGISMGRRDYLVGPTGDYSVQEQDSDAQGEALAILVDSAVRLPEKPAKVGETWTREWAGKRQQKNTDGVFGYKQTARLEALAGGRARISYTIQGVLQIAAAKNPNAESTTLEGKGTVVLDVASGTVIESDSSGAIVTELKKPGVKMVRRIGAKFKVS